MFSSEYCEILKNTDFEEHLPTVASGSWKKNDFLKNSYQCIYLMQNMSLFPNIQLFPDPNYLGKGGGGALSIIFNEKTGCATIFCDFCDCSVGILWLCEWTIFIENG